jgi:hypothetical protein
MKTEHLRRPVLLRGFIQGLVKRRVSDRAVFTGSDRQAAEQTALVAALAGLNDIALNLSTSTQFTDTVADLVTFRLGEEQVRAWIWLSVFENGDEVEVVAERAGSGWIGYAIRRCSDGVLSVHPNSERGSMALFRHLLKLVMSIFAFGAFVPTVLIGAMIVFNGLRDRWDFAIRVFMIGWFAMGLIGFFVTLRIWLRFKMIFPMANMIFSTFGWSNPSSIDLPRFSKKLKKPGDGWQMGKLIFRYVE